MIRDWIAGLLGHRRFRLEPASADASFRRYLRLRVGRTTRIVMDAPPEHESCTPFLALGARLRAAGIHAPRVFAADPARGLVLLEDLGATSYLDALRGHRHGPAPEVGAERLYGDALETLVRMQARVGCDGLARYDRAALEAEMELFPVWLLGRHLGIRLAGRDAGLLVEARAALVAAAVEQPQAFVHRDYHSRNLMYCPGANPGVLDFQDALRGPLSYDLTSLLRDAYVAWPQAQVEAWAERYLERARRAGLLSGVGPGKLRRWLELTGAQRQLKVAGIFARLWYRDGKPGYLADIPRVLGYLLAAAPRHPEIRPLGELLARLEVIERVEARNAELLGEPEGGR